MWLFDYFWSLLDSLGLRNKTGKLLFVGLDNAGKTTLLRLLRDGLVILHQPTHKANCEKLSLGGIDLLAYDLGGHDQMRRVWREYFFAVDGIVFIVDVADEEKLPVAREELKEILSDEVVEGVPILILGNKIDKPGALGEKELASYLGIHPTATKGAKGRQTGDLRALGLFMCSITKKVGYGDAFRWLAQQL